MTKEDLIENLRNEKFELEEKLHNEDYYNRRNTFFRKLINIPLVLDKITPYLISGAIVFSGFKYLNETPFIIDTTDEKIMLELVDTSSGIHREAEIYNGIDKLSIEYSEGWKYNDYGLYERRKTTYIMNKDLNLSKEEILSMTKDDLERLFIKSYEEIVTRENLTEKDMFYNDNMVIYTSTIDLGTYNIKSEPFEENIIETFFYLIITFLLGKNIEKVKAIIFHDKFRNKLEVLKGNYSMVDENIILEQLRIKEDNLSLLGDEYVKRK